MNDNDYLEKNFIEQYALCKETNISLKYLNELIAHELVPEASYEKETITRITSPLGDTKEIVDVKRYFSNSTVYYIEKNRDCTSEAFKAQMKEEYIQAVIVHDTEHLLHQEIAELDDIFETRWKYFTAGVYGICTLNSTAEEIAKKGIIVQKLINFQNNETESTKEKKQQQLTILNEEYNNVATLFAPYQRKTSSRGKHVDRQLKEHNLDNLIRKYK